jgi:hypothetical protein
MTRIASPSPRLPIFANRLLDFFLQSETRCHVIAGGTSVVLAFAIGWVWSGAGAMNGESKHDARLLQESTLVLGHADLLREHYQQCLRHQESLKRRADAIGQWLPASIHWETTSAEIRNLADSLGLEVIALDREGKSVGSRLGVVLAELHVRGAFHSIGDLLRRLPKNDIETTGGDVHPAAAVLAEVDSTRGSIEPACVSDESPSATATKPGTRMPQYPIWCHHLRLRSDPEPRGKAGRCDAIVGLRIPFAAAGTAAAMLEPGSPST